MYIMDAIVILLVIIMRSATAPPLCLAAGAELMTWKCSNNRTSYSPNSTYESNVRGLIASLAANASSKSPIGFATGTVVVGSGTDTLWGAALCRGDTAGAACASCLALSAPDVALGKCRGSRDASAFYDRCLVRVSGEEDFLSSRDNTQVQIMGSSKDSVVGDGGTKAERFGALVAYLLGALSDVAAFDNNGTRYAVGVVSSDGDGEGFVATTTEVVRRVNGMVQCTPDQAPAACRGCLQGLVRDMAAAANGSIGGQINAVWCRLRYEVWQFYDGSPMLRLVAPPLSSGDPKGDGTRGRTNAVTAMAIAIVLGVVVIVLSVFTILLWRKTKPKREQLHTKMKRMCITNVSAQANEEDDHAGSSLLFDLSTLRCATSDFAEENKLGHGGFGAVYKGLLPDGREIAVKRLDKASRQGLKELKNELLLVVKLRHNNLAKLLGVCLDGQEKLLVYEYLPNRSLDIFLFKRHEDLMSELLDWHTRYRIIYGVARGLLYLHEDTQARIIHRDLKASNILLDGDMTPKISDFGLARLFDSEKTTTITSQVVGTLGYMAPEYAVLGQISVKLDVYSFGVLTLEIITGRRNTDVFDSVEEEPNTLLSYVWDHWSKGTPSKVINRWLQQQAPENEVLKCIHLGLLCVQENPSDRPTMLSVLVMLHGEASSFESPSKPAFIYKSSGIDSSKSYSKGLGVQRVVANDQGSTNSISVSDFNPR
uniref:Protein kinase domain-containing protein n=1 Tax=Leersia perrieri TaxID=77586 RepID=A0A0D9VWD1_9ORYZ